MSNQNGRQNSKIKGGNKGIVIVSVVAIVIISILVGIIVFLLKPQEEQERQRNVVVKPENVEEVIEQMKEEEKIPVGAYEVSMNTKWIFPDGTSVSENAFVENSTANTTMVYFIIKIDNEEVYHSPYMEVGSYLKEIQLGKDLEKGEYDAVITYHLVDDDFNDLSQVSMKMKIVVEN